MPKPRSQLVDLEATPYYHCISRCVRRAFLLGRDKLTGYCFDHRRQWIVDRMKELSGIFAIDVCSYGLMENHFHVILHVDRERALAWTDEQVANAYGSVFPATVRAVRELPESVQVKKVAVWRKRLFNLSWYMRCLNERIARRANREDNCTGRFWEGRFRSQALLDAGALVTCMAYVDLNPIRAGVATTLEESQFTSIQERLLAAARGQSADGLVGFATAGPSEANVLPIQFEDYVEILRWTAAAIREPQGGVPQAIAARLEAVELESGGFVESVRNYARSFFTMVGHVHRIDTESRRRGYKRRPGLPAARRLYRARAA